MISAAFCLISLAVLLGAILIMPHRSVLAEIPRWMGAVSHGVLGASGLAMLCWTADRHDAVSPTWLAIGLLAAGLIAGGTIFMACRHRRPPPALILAIHIVFAGMGYLLLAGLILS